MDEQTSKEFQFEFEKLVVLDYMIRNTDRNNDNWLVRQIEKKSGEEAEDGEPSENGKERSEDSIKKSEVDEVLTWNNVEIQNLIKIAAIDNGLAFPFKHPDEWRACECCWKPVVAVLIWFLSLLKLISNSYPQTRTTGHGYPSLKYRSPTRSRIWFYPN